MIDNRFGYGTWRAIIAERAKRIAEEKEAIKQAKIEAERKRKKRNEEIKFAMFVTSIIGAVTGLLVLVVLIVFS
jgi:F0F1-type ATP synthase membrane subunit b/b'